jgi:shikimate kinase
LREKGITVWLKADLDVLLRRIKRRSDRPLLKTDDPEEVLRRLMAERHPIYQEADLIVHSREVPHETIVEEIVGAVVAKLGLAPRSTRAGAP